MVPLREPRAPRRYRAGLAVALSLALLAGSARSIIPHGTYVYDRAPLDRLLQNIGRQARENPRDAHLNYVLGRVHTFAYAFGLDEVWTSGSDAALRLPTDSLVAREQRPEGAALRRKLDSKGVEALQDLRRAHLEAALCHTALAAALEPDSPFHQLALASILDQGAPFASELDSAAFLPNARRPVVRSNELEAILDGAASHDGVLDPDEQHALLGRAPQYLSTLNEYRAEARVARFLAVRACLRLCWKREAMEAYAKAFRLAADVDLGTAAGWSKHGDFYGATDLVSYEAGRCLLRVSEEIHWAVPAPLGPGLIRKHLAKLEEMEDRMPVSPVVFSLERAGSLSSLLAEGSSVLFDLDGDGRAEYWPWVRPGTALLVWDPEGRGEVRSGRQLFGSVTWWLFFRDGYEALSGLDDDGDGWLSGAELAGLGLWFDRNTNGLSEPGEVLPIECSQVRAIAAWSDTIDGLAPGCSEGLVLADGRRLPTYDWMAQPLSSSEARSCRP